MNRFNRLILGAIATSTLMLAIGCNNDPAAGKTKVDASAPVEQKQQKTEATGIVFPITEKDGSIQFVGAKVSDKHEGAFETFTGKINYVDGHIEQSSVELAVDVNSMKIDPPKLKKHLMSGDFFEAEKYPKATFSSTSVTERPTETSTHEITGNLELRGTRKSITFPAMIKASPAGVSVEAEFAINRKDFGIVYPGMPDDLIKDEVLLKLKLNPKK